jgi:hypothetical protein
MQVTFLFVKDSLGSQNLNLKSSFTTFAPGSILSILNIKNGISNH